MHDLGQVHDPLARAARVRLRVREAPLWISSITSLLSAHPVRLTVDNTTPRNLRANTQPLTPFQPRTTGKALYPDSIPRTSLPDINTIAGPRPPS